MGEYSGKVEKSAKVVFAGADKKMTMVASAKQVDAAGREQAVADYMEFTFNVMNGLMPNPKMSKRRIAILLRYVHHRGPAVHRSSCCCATPPWPSCRRCARAC